MPELWLRKIFPATVFVSTDMPEKRIRIAKTKEQLDHLDDNNTDIFKSNITERYSIRPSIHVMEKLCLAKFEAFYYKDYKRENNETIDAQPDVLTDDLIEINHDINYLNSDALLPEKIKLINTNETMKRRKIKAVIRYH